MKSKIKVISKRILVIWLIILMLLPSIFSGVVLADGDKNTNGEKYVAKLNAERAGNYVANFAINFYENWSSGSSHSLSANTTERREGEIRTKYDSSASVFTEINESADEYLISNDSWIGLVYSQSLFDGNATSTFSSASQINTQNFMDKDELFGDQVVGYAVLDIQTLISEGKIQPGDILIAEHDGMTEKLLYVGGARVIYATADENSGPSGALKYEYIDNYLKRIREQYSGDAIPQYGITQVYRLKREVAEEIPEEDANLFFNGRGYYSESNYRGLPKEVSVTSELSEWKFVWVFEKLLQLLKFIINLIVYMIRMQIVGWVNLFETAIQHLVFGLSGNNEGDSWEAFFGTKATSGSGRRLTVESIFFNKIPILDANFFDYNTAGGRQLVPQTAEAGTPISGPLRLGEERAVVTEVSYEDNLIYTVRKNLAALYVTFRNIAIAIMLFILVAVGIKMAVTSIAEKKAKITSFLTTWFYCLVMIVSMHLFMVFAFQVNDLFVKKFETIADTESRQHVSQYVDSTDEDTLNLYDAVRIKAYTFNWSEGVPATIVYIFIVYLEVRFLLIYFKRYLTVYLLALSAPFMGLKHAIDSLMGKKANSLNKWFKDFGFNVLLQTVHSLVYVIFIGLAMSVPKDSVGGALIAVAILHLMLTADKTIIKIFGLDKAGSLADVNQPESWGQLFRKALPIYTIGKGAENLMKGTMFGERGLLTRLRRDLTGEATNEKADEKWLKWKFQTIGAVAGGADWLSGKFDKLLKTNLPDGKITRAIDNSKIGGLLNKLNGIDYKLGSIRRYATLFNKNLSFDTMQKNYSDIQKYKQLKKKRFTRKIDTIKDLTLGTAGRIASIAVAIDDPSAGAALWLKSNKMISKHKTRSKLTRKMQRYGRGSVNALHDLNNAKRDYRKTLDDYADNEYLFQQEYERLLAEWHQADADGRIGDRNDITDDLRRLVKQRRRQRSVELHKLQEADENLTRRKIEYGNAKHEDRSSKFLETITGLSEIENIVNTETRATFKADDVVKKQGKRLDHMEKAAKEEKEFTALVGNLNREIRNYATANGLNNRQATELFNNAMDVVESESKMMNVESSDVDKAVGKYLTENITVDRINENAVDEIVNNLNAILAKKEHDNHEPKIRIDNSMRDKIKKQLELSKIKDNKGLGYDRKDATTIIREAIGSDGVLPDSSALLSSNPAIADALQKVLKKANKLNTYNEVGKYKHKSEILDIEEIFDEAKSRKK